MLLLLEYLHAHEKWYAESSPSLRAEGRAMLQAVASDLASAKIPAAVALCPQAANEMTMELPIVPSFGTTPQQIAKELVAAHPWDVAVPIAPECDGILTDLVKAFRHHRCTVTTLPVPLVECFSDKWATYQFLKDHAVATVPATLVDDWKKQDWPADSRCVIKSRDGLSCEGIRNCSTAELQAILAAESMTNSSHIIQPFIEGTPRSVGCLRRGQDVEILPAVRQSIQWDKNHPRYVGGFLDPGVPGRNAACQSLAEQVVECLPEFTGYVGIDMIVSPDGHAAVMEVNPRLCSSYVGYRQATDQNLMTWMLQNGPAPHWNHGPIKF